MKYSKRFTESVNFFLKSPNITAKRLMRSGPIHMGDYRQDVSASPLPHSWGRWPAARGGG